MNKPELGPSNLSVIHPSCVLSQSLAQVRAVALRANGCKPFTASPTVTVSILPKIPHLKYVRDTILIGWSDDTAAIGQCSPFIGWKRRPGLGETLCAR